MHLQLRIACAVIAWTAVTAAVAGNPADVTLVKDLSKGVRLHEVDGKRVWPVRGHRITLSPGVHTLEFRYAFDYQRAFNGGFVVAYAFECDFTSAGPYTLRSRDSRVTAMVPTIWIEAEGRSLPDCRALER